MSALWYIIITSSKNRLKEVLHKPAKLVLYILCICGIASLIVLPLFDMQQSTDIIDSIWLKAAYFAFVTLFFMLAVQKGLANGDMIFEMHDVNFLFVSPVSPKSILIYGLVRMTKTAFFAAFFILFQGSTIKNLFGSGFSSVFIIFFNFMLIIVLFSILSLFIYNITNGRPKRKRIVRLLTASLFVPLVIVFCIQLFQTQNLATATQYALQSPVFSWTAFSGWASEATLSFIEGQIGSGIFFTGVMLCSGVLLVCYILFGTIDYYEDVLLASETAFEKKRAITEGQANMESLSNSKIKVVKTGIGGIGASTFLYKHLRETTRANAFALLSWSTILIIFSAAMLAFFMRNEGGSSVVILQILMWVQVFLIGTGRGIKELLTHYIYLIPENSFSKIFWSNLEPLVKVLIESTLVFTIAGIIATESPVIILGCIVVFTLFSLMLISINYLTMRWFGTDISQGILLMMYMLIVIVFLLPGLIPALIIAFTFDTVIGTIIAFAILSLWELLVALICFTLSKGVLHRCDMQHIRSI